MIMPKLVCEKDWFDVGEVEVRCSRSDDVYNNRRQTLKKLIQKLNFRGNVRHGLQHAAKKMSDKNALPLRWQGKKWNAASWSVLSVIRQKIVSKHKIDYVRSYCNCALLCFYLKLQHLTTVSQTSLNNRICEMTFTICPLPTFTNFFVLAEHTRR